MCFNKELSMTSFLFGIISSILLINFGNNNNSNVNSAIGYFYIFISMVQLFEFLMWSDIKCKNNINKITTKIMPLMVYSQPIVYGGIMRYFLNSNSSNIISDDILYALNILYAIILLFNYANEKIGISCTNINEENHLSWDFSQKNIFNLKIAYNLLMIINSINYLHNNSVKIHMLWVYSMLLLSNSITKKNLAELWCFSSTSTPLIVYLFQNI
jgi:hypothetical protein